MTSHIIKTSLIVQISSRILPLSNGISMARDQNLVVFLIATDSPLYLSESKDLRSNAFPIKLIRRSKIFHEHGNKRRPVRGNPLPTLMNQ